MGKWQLNEVNVYKGRDVVVSGYMSDGPHVMCCYCMSTGIADLEAI